MKRHKNEKELKTKAKAQDFIIDHPSSEADFAERDRLLQACLRPEPAPFGIRSEYPIVLAPENRLMSLVMREQATGKIVAHANLFPRRLVCDPPLPELALVGNVATDSSWRGRGLMTLLFAELDRKAQAQNLGALVLWSDLLQFYQTLGFTSHGSEFRYFLHWDELKAFDPRAAGRVRRFTADELTDHQLSQLLSLRYPVKYTLARSVDEFRRLLSIPQCDLYAAEKNGVFSEFFVIGKGADMIGVAHEWGAGSPQAACSGLKQILDSTGWNEIILLAPGKLNATWRKPIAFAARRTETHPLALVKAPKDSALVPALDEGFIWGLDSI